MLTKSATTTSPSEQQDERMCLNHGPSVTVHFKGNGICPLCRLQTQYEMVCDELNGNPNHK